MNGKKLFYIMIPSVAVVVIVALATSQIRQQREWFRIQTEQIQAFTSLEKFPPKGVDSQSWRSAISTPINVWMNATYHPDHSHISNAEMTSLLNRVRAINSKATTENSIQSVDDVLTILAERDHMKAFVVGFREEFRSQFPGHFRSAE